MKKLFIFDLDGVLTSTSDEHFKAWTIFGKEFDITIDKSLEEKTKGVSRMDSLEIILKSASLVDKYTLNQKNKMAEYKNNTYKNLISGYSRINLFDGVIKLFEYLKSKDILIALGSASQNGPRLLESMEITKYFDYIVDPSKLNSKPSPDIFSNAAHHFLLKDEECVGIEDSISGIQAINKAGMFSIGIGAIQNLHEANIIYSDISKINFDYLDKLISDQL